MESPENDFNLSEILTNGITYSGSNEQAGPVKETSDLAKLIRQKTQLENWFLNNYQVLPSEEEIQFLKGHEKEEEDYYRKIDELEKCKVHINELKKGN